MELINVLYLLVTVLFGGTVFAWVNVFLEFTKVCKACNTEGVNIFWSKCFWGAMFFTLSFILSVYATYLVR